MRGQSKNSDDDISGAVHLLSSDTSLAPFMPETVDAFHMKIIQPSLPLHPMSCRLVFAVAFAWPLCWFDARECLSYTNVCIKNWA